MFKDRIDRLKGLKLTDQAAAKISKTFDTVDFEGEVKQEKWKKVQWVEKWGVTKASIKRGRIEMMAHKDGSFSVTGLTQAELKKLINNI